MSIRIPKQLHQIWVGPKPIPDQQREWIQGWKEKHPDWKHHLWREEEVREHLPEEALAFFEAAQSYAGQTDVARVWLVHKFGGVYVDTDFQCLRQIDELLHGCKAFTVVEGYDGKLMNGLFGTVPGHPFTETLIEDWGRRFDPENPTQTGPLFFDDVVRGKKRSDVRIFEREIFAPVTGGDLHRLETETESDWDDSYAVHHYEQSWQEEVDWESILESRRRKNYVLYKVQSHARHLKKRALKKIRGSSLYPYYAWAKNKLSDNQ
ncbi:mannosyltransferase OCH1-like enzyme [Salinibacter ruber]|uniref:glycosyltransferase family 32 protein n=1 Tax=Salinibacter ruber TaxID=146919 RepID=UPI00216AA82A|nr:glycosyltransferase [Salinibacter ruber]MCS3668069.1 mannosyltransferase OCH1-like enzyme [Salinibacter ruber]